MHSIRVCHSEVSEHVYYTIPFLYKRCAIWRLFIFYKSRARVYVAIHLIRQDTVRLYNRTPNTNSQEVRVCVI